MLKKIRELFIGRRLNERYNYFEPAIEALGNYSLSRTPTLKEIGLTKSMTQLAYRYIKQWSFEGDIIDFLCFVSSDEIVKSFLAEWEYANRDIKIVNEQSDDYEGMPAGDNGFWALGGLPLKNSDLRNFYRLLVRNPFCILTRKEVLKIVDDATDRYYDFFKRVERRPETSRDEKRQDMIQLLFGKWAKDYLYEIMRDHTYGPPNNPIKKK